MRASLTREDLQRRNPFVQPQRPRRWAAVPAGCRPLRADEPIRRGDVMCVAQNWYEEYSGFSLVGKLPGPPSRIYAATWYRWERLS
ncbi:MAG: hypothetical protein ISP90_03885 [Nevskia sp.]|nr:hypothetical protein [Nevskia sp.]